MEERIKYALEHTEVLKPPKQLLATFGTSTVYYYLLTKPIYSDLIQHEETVIRKGKMTWYRPRLITPGYMLRLEGFSSESKDALMMLARDNPNVAGLLYEMKFIKEFEKMEIVSNSLIEVSKRIEKDIDKKQDSLCAVIKGVDELWDVSLMKFAHEMMLKSAYLSQIPNLAQSGLIETNSRGYPVVSQDEYGVPLTAKLELEMLFEQVRKKEIDPSILKQELDKWGLFQKYEDKFFDLFRKK